MRIRILIVLVLASVMTGHAQKEGQVLVDSLYSELPKAKEDTNKVRLLAGISYEMRHIDPRAGLSPGFKALILAIKLKDVYGQGLARFSLALNYNYLSMLSESIDQSILAAAMFEKCRASELLAATWFGLAQTYMSFDTALSRKYMLRAKALLPKNKNITWIVRNYGSLGNSYKNLDERDSAKKYIRIHLNMALKYRMKWQAMLALNRIGSMDYFEGRSDTAYHLLKQALEYFKSIGARQMVPQSCLTLGRIIMQRLPAAGPAKEKLLDTAIAYGSQALQASTGIGFVMQMLGSTHLLADLYSIKGDTGTAFKYILMAEKYNEMLYGVKVVTRAAMLNQKNEERIKNQRLELLELKNRQQLVFVFVSASGLMILIIVVVIIINSRRKLKRSYRLVNQKNDEITRIMGELTIINGKLEASNRDFAAANQELEAFSYSVSHDLRAPVRRIESLGKLLIEDYEKLLDEEGKDLLKRISESSALMNSLIEDMLKLSRITRQAVSKAPCNISEMAAKICGELKLSYPGREYSCSIEEGMEVFADSSLIRIALQNLLDNAFKYSSLTEHPEITIRSEEKENSKIMIIQDNGAGFDMSLAGKLFTPFQRMHTDEQFKGTGIGLATVKRIIVKHGGSIAVSSEPGKGTMFSLTF